MQTLLIKVISSAKNNLDIWFFYGFLFTSMLSLRKILFSFPLENHFNEYTSIYLYVSDIFLIITIALWIILHNNINYLSSSFNYIFIRKNFAYIIPFLFILWSFISIFWADNQLLASFRSIKLFEFYFLFLYVSKRIVPRGTLLRDSLLIMILIGLINAIIGVFQFVLQNSLGLRILRESIISTDISGVAKVIIDGEVYIRSYGLFPHPNIFGGFLVLTIIISWNLIRKRQYLPFHEKVNIRYWLILAIILQFSALILTFSKSAFFGLIIGVVFLHTIVLPNKSNCSTWNNFLAGIAGLLKNNIHKSVITLLFIIGLSSMFFSRVDNRAFFIQSLHERSVYIEISQNIVQKSPILGIGSGNFVWDMQNFIEEPLLYWQFQPVHNVFLLILSELGVVGLLLFLWFFSKLFQNKRKVISHETISHESNAEYKPTSFHSEFDCFGSILIAFLFIMFFDHYFWDIQQGQILFWMTLGIICASQNKKLLDSKSD